MSEEKEVKKEISSEITEKDSHNETYGVLLSDEIQYYVKEFHLIEPFEPKNLRPAGYDFTIGTTYKREGKLMTLDEKNPNLTIKPHEAVFVCTKEKLNMPRFLVGRWNLKISRVWEGLVWVGGVHVDPGWKGELWCPIYNLSKDPVTLHPDETFATVDFEKTTLFKKDVSKEYIQRPKEKNTQVVVSKNYLLK